jgi:hypothetical protein
VQVRSTPGQGEAGPPTVSVQKIERTEQRDRNTVSQAMSRSQSIPTASACLKSDTQAQLERVNAFLKDRLAKSPAYDPKFMNDPQYSAKEEAYEQDTAHLYVEKFWPSTQALLRRAVAASITPEGTESLSLTRLGIQSLSGGKRCSSLDTGSSFLYLSKLQIAKPPLLVKLPKWTATESRVKSSQDRQRVHPGRTRRLYESLIEQASMLGT